MILELLATLLVAPAAGAATLTLPDAPAGPGMVRLELADPEAGDPPGALRLRAVLAGPLEGEGAADLFALNAVLVYPSDRLAYVPGSVRKGDLLERDGKSSLITAGGKSSAGSTRLTIGASRLGAVPGVSAPSGPSVLFTLALQVLKPGDAVLSWEEATFINSQVRPVAAARFLGATLHAPAPSAHEETP